ncbi:hypothetical protein FOA52_008944 [Chlamydomonas sp. UWO 241]|nr:hypothetical protein FOA52_008944 [Chlamydomonas sp. UWO 241]
MDESSEAGWPQDEPWEIVWCYVGWYDVADRLERMLPSWARLVRMSGDRPLSEQVANCDVLIPTTGTVDAAIIRAAPKCKLIAQPAAGHDNIDRGVARELGIPVTIAPGSNAQSVAEAALMMMLTLARRVREGQAVFADRRIGEPVGMELCGKQLGIVGMGRVGEALGRVATGLGMTVFGVSSASSRGELESLLTVSHVVSLHCPLNARTTGLIGRTELSLMRPGALLINCARGAVIDKEALCEALDAGLLGGVGLDVHWVEPADPEEPLYQHKRVLALPHTGTITHEVCERFAQVLFENILRRRDGRPPLNQLCC